MISICVFIISNIASCFGCHFSFNSSAYFLIHHRSKIAIPEAKNGFNAAEFADGIQTQVTLPTGTLAGDRITITVTPTGNGEPVDVTYIVTDTDIAAGITAVTVPNGMGGITEDGDYSVIATVTDIAGNTSAASEPVDFNLDTMAPLDTVITVNSLTDDNVINTAESESEADVAITGTITGEFTLDDIVTVTVNGTDYTGMVDMYGNFSIAVSGTELPSILKR